MDTQHNPDESPHATKLPAIYLWVPIWLAFIALGWVIHHKNSATAVDVPFDSVSEPVTMYGADKNTTILKSNSLGHYLFVGYINDKPVKFLLDTGATSVAIPGHLADYLGLSQGQKYYASTANGKAVAYNSLIKKIEVGNIEQGDIQGAIMPGMQGNEILLGMSFLKNLEITQKDGEVSLVQYKM